MGEARPFLVFLLSLSHPRRTMIDWSTIGRGWGRKYVDFAVAMSRGGDSTGYLILRNLRVVSKAMHGDLHI